MTHHKMIIVLFATASCSVARQHYGTGSGSDGGPTTLAVASPTYDFGTVVVHTTTAIAGITVTNNGPVPTGELAAATLGGPDAAAFALDVDGCAGHVLAPQQSCVVRVKSTPTTPGTPSAMLTVSAMPGGSVGVMLSENAVAVGALQIQPTTFDFGSISPSAFTTDTVFTVTNTGGSSSGPVQAATLSGSDATQFTISSDSCSGMNLAPAKTCMVAVKFAPTSAGTKAATLSLTSGAAGTGVATLGGKALAPPLLVVTPPSDDFHLVNVMNAAAAHGYTFSNSGELPTGALSISLEGGDATQFQISSDSCTGMKLAAGASCSVNVAFAPTTVGIKSAVLAGSTTPGGSASSQLTGTSIAPADLVFAPTNNNFGNQDVGTASSEVAFTLTNTGTVPSSTVTASLGGTDPGEFRIVNDGCSGQVLDASGTCMVTVSFAPTVYGNHSASLVANATTGGTSVASLSGNGRDKLSVTVLTSGGSGTGTVAASAGSLACSGGTCTGTFYRGTMLTLSATPDAGMVFRSWSGACTASPCALTVDGNLMVTAAFDIAQAQLVAATTSDDLGQVVIGGSTVPRSYKFTNTGNISTGTIAAALGGSDAGQFVASNDTCSGKTLAPSASCSVSVAFAPGTSGAKTANLSASATPGGAAAVALTGTGLAPASIGFQPTSLAYGVVDVGTTTTAATVTLRNTGGVATSAVATSLGGANAGDFAIASDACNGNPLAPGGSCDISVSFTPSAYGSRGATLLASSAAGGTTSVTLGGTGRDQVTLTVNIVGNGSGTISVPVVTPSSGQVGAMTCVASACSGQFYRGTVVTLAANPSSGSLFQGWGTSGACAGDGKGQCPSVTLSANTTASATFVLAVATLGVSPATPDLGQVVVNGSGSPVAITFSNSGTIATGSIVTSLGGNDAGMFTVLSDGCVGAKLAPGAGCTVQAYFAPSSAGSKSATLTASANPGGQVAATLTATALVPASLALSPVNNDYGNQDVGTSSAASVYTLQNSGTQPTTAITTSMVGANPGDFTIVSDGCNNQVLAASSSCTVSVAFAPSAYGARSATLRAAASTGGVATSSLAGFGRDKFTLTAATGGDGTGALAVNPQPLEGALACSGGSCTGTYYHGTAVTLTETPLTGSTFGGWSSACTVDANGRCNVTMNTNIGVTATFLGRHNLMFSTSAAGSAAGSIGISPAGVSCGTGCVSFVTGTAVRLTATASAGYFSGWSGSCSGSSTTCDLTMNADATVSASFQPPNLAFVTSAAYAPPAGSDVTWADAQCHSAAAAAGISGTFVAYWGGTSLSTRLGNASGWVRADGLPFAATKADLVNGHELYPLVVTENRTQVAADQFVLTNATGNNCSGWTAGQPWYTNYSGIAGGGWGQAAYYAIYSSKTQPACVTALPLYCFQVDYNVTLTYQHQSGRYAFVASGYQSLPTGGLASLDAICTAKASAASLPGTYKALTSTTTASAASRFSTSGSTWVRPDGIPLVASPTDLLASSPNYVSPFDVDETGGHASWFLTATGATFVSTGSTANTCADWTVNTAYQVSGLSPMAGVTGYPGETSIAGTGYGCDGIYTVYCLEQ